MIIMKLAKCNCMIITSRGRGKLFWINLAQKEIILICFIFELPRSPPISKGCKNFSQKTKFSSFGDAKKLFGSFMHLCLFHISHLIAWMSWVWWFVWYWKSSMISWRMNTLLWKKPWSSWILWLNREKRILWVFKQEPAEER